MFNYIHYLWLSAKQIWLERRKAVIRTLYPRPEGRGFTVKIDKKALQKSIWQGSMQLSTGGNHT